MNEITQAWAGMNVGEYKKFKSLKKENLRDNMNNLELVLNMLAEAATTEISKKEDPKTFPESKVIAKKGGTIAGNTRRDIESQLGRPVVSPKNARLSGDAFLNKSKIIGGGMKKIKHKTK